LAHPPTSIPGEWKARAGVEGKSKRMGRRPQAHSIWISIASVLVNFWRVSRGRPNEAQKLSHGSMSARPDPPERRILLLVVRAWNLRGPKDGPCTTRSRMPRGSWRISSLYFRVL